MQIDNSSPISKPFMENKGSFQYVTDSGVLIVKCLGDVSIKGLSFIWEEIAQEFPVSSRIKGVVFDLSSGNFAFPAPDHGRIVGFLKKHHDFFRHYRVGVVANSPHNIVVAMLVARADSNYCVRPFTTLKAALHWVKDTA